MKAVGINYAPCLISTSARGFDATAAAVNFQPNVIEILAEGLAVWPQAVNIQPALIYVNPWGLNVRCATMLKQSTASAFSCQGEIMPTTNVLASEEVVT